MDPPGLAHPHQHRDLRARHTAVDPGQHRQPLNYVASLRGRPTSRSLTPTPDLGAPRTRRRTPQSKISTPAKARSASLPPTLATRKRPKASLAALPLPWRSSTVVLLTLHNVSGSRGINVSRRGENVSDRGIRSARPAAQPRGRCVRARPPVAATEVQGDRSHTSVPLGRWRHPMTPVNPATPRP
jgi:hypothetical protein